MKKIIAGFACFVLIGQLLLAQSVYSFQGIGSINHRGMPNNFAMGEVGIGTPTNWHINTMNPANLVYNNLSSFQFGFEIDRRSFSGDDVSGSDTYGGLRFLTYAFPVISGKWSSSFGVLPLSTVGYNTFSESPIVGAPNNATQILDQRGRGGLTDLYWSNGFAITKNLYFGLRTSFTFGAINRRTEVSILEEQIITNSIGELDTVRVLINSAEDINYKESYRDFNYQIGLAYKIKLSEKSRINLGLIFSPSSEVKRTILLEDTVDTSFERRLDLPKNVGFGISYEKTNYYTIGIDIENSYWKNSSTEATEFNDSFKFSIGGSLIPSYSSVNSYFSRARYSVGFNYQKLPYIVESQGLTDFGINFGASLPISGFSSVDMAFKVGQLGETRNGLIKETYFKIVLGATINDRWFIKRKYD